VLTFPAGTTTQTINVLVRGDTLDENDETFNVNLSSATNATIADAAGLGTIQDDDPSPSLTISDASIVEGNNGNRSVTFSVSLSAPSGRSVSVSYATANGTATAGSDYNSKSGALTFSAGTTVQTISVTVRGDRTVEPNETFLVDLTNPTNATLGKNQGVGTIINDD
jgi:hypothetical protein